MLLNAVVILSPHLTWTISSIWCSLSLPSQNTFFTWHPKQHTLLVFFLPWYSLLSLLCCCFFLLLLLFTFLVFKQLTCLDLTPFLLYLYSSLVISKFYISTLDFSLEIHTTFGYLTSITNVIGPQLNSLKTFFPSIDFSVSVVATPSFQLFSLKALQSFSTSLFVLVPTQSISEIY